MYIISFILANDSGLFQPSMTRIIILFHQKINAIGTVFYKAPFYPSVFFHIAYRIVCSINSFIHIFSPKNAKLGCEIQTELEKQIVF